MSSVTPIEYGDYYLTRKIATGGMAELFRARKVGEAGFEKQLVIKRLLPHLAEDQDLRTMFLDEARLASRLTHVNIAQVFDLGLARAADPSRPQQEATYFIAMEYVFGKSLAEVIRRGQARNKPLSIENAVKIILSAAQGLQYAHSRRDDQGNPLGLVHRDISPQNILISYEGEVKLVDFGIAKALNQSNTTRPGMLKGKFSYMAPEQARGEAVDQRTDIYALGVVLWETLTGRRLFTGDSEATILSKVLEPRVEPPSSIMEGLPPELDDICLKCLRPDPDQRYPDAQALCDAMEKYLQGLTTFPSTYSLRNYMHELFGEEIAEETEQIRQETEAVHQLVAGAKPKEPAAPAGGEAAGPAEPTQLYQPPAEDPGRGKGKGKLWAILGGAAVLVVVALVLVLGGGDEPAPIPPAGRPQAQAPKPAVGAPAEAPRPAPAAQEKTPASPTPAREPAPAPRPAEPPLVIQAREDLKAQRFAQALEKLDQAVAQDEKLAALVARDRARALLGLAAQESGEDPQKALADLEKAAAYAPDWAEVPFQRGRILTRLKRLDQALAAYAKALELDPEMDAAHFNQGYIYLQKGQLDQAVAAFQRVVDLDSPFKADAYLNLAVCSVRQGDKARAVEMLKRALVANPNHKLAQRYLDKLTSAPAGGKP